MSHNVVLVVSGGIAAYKACEVLRALQRADCDVRVCMTQDATHFIGTTTFEALTHHSVAHDLYTYPESDIPHISLTDWADLIVVCPATANIVAKMVHGIADDCASTLLLAAGSPIVVAPAMNVRMWKHPATQSNLLCLQARGVLVVQPDEGLLACGALGEGKLASVGEIVNISLDILNEAAHMQTELSGKKIMVTAGPTHESIDPVRFIANASSGKTGYAIAAELARRGAEVTLISGPCNLETPSGVTRVDVISASQMLEACTNYFEESDACICTAAVADYMPKNSADHKLKKDEGKLSSIELVETPDILASLSARKGSRIVIGFAAETNDMLKNAQRKLVKKGCDLIIANDVSRKDSGFGSDTRKVTFVSQDAVEEKPTTSLCELSKNVADKLCQLMTK